MKMNKTKKVKLIRMLKTWIWKTKMSPKVVIETTTTMTMSLKVVNKMMTTRRKMMKMIQDETRIRTLRPKRRDPNLMKKTK